MTTLDAQTKHKLREMGAGSLLEALEGQDDVLALAMGFEDLIQLAVDDAYATFTNAIVACSRTHRMGARSGHRRAGPDGA